MSSYRLRQRWRHVRTRAALSVFVSNVTERTAQCLREMIQGLYRGEVDLAKSQFEPDLYYIYRCKVIISAAVRGDTVVLLAVTVPRRQDELA